MGTGVGAYLCSPSDTIICANEGKLAHDSEVRVLAHCRHAGKGSDDEGKGEGKASLQVPSGGRRKKVTLSGVEGGKAGEASMDSTPCPVAHWQSSRTREAKNSYRKKARVTTSEEGGQ